MQLFNIRPVLLGVCLLLAWAGPSSGTTTDSKTWEGRYECDASPAEAGWIAKMSGADSYAKVEDGKLIINTLGSNQFPYWLKEVKLDVTRGISVEWRVKIRQTEAGDIASGTVLGIRSTSGSKPNEFIGMSVGERAIHCQGVDLPFDGGDRFHVYRITIEPGGYKLYVDNHPTPVASGALAASDGKNTDQGIQFGDHSADADAEYEVDYIAWTTAGAFVPDGSTVADKAEVVELNDQGLRALAEEGNLILAVAAANKPPTADGVVNEGEYAFDGLGFVDVVSGQYASRQSRYHLSYDENALYVAIESPVRGKLRSKVVRRDDSTVCLEDSAEIFIVTGSGISPQFQLILNSRGTLFDQKDSIVDWNIKATRIANKVDDDRWTMEARIPYSDLGIAAPMAGDIWRINLCRTYSGSTQLFTGMAPTRHSYLSPRRFAYVRFLGQGPTVTMKSLGELHKLKLDLDLAMKDKAGSAGPLDVRVELLRGREREILVQQQFKEGQPVAVELHRDELADQGELRVIATSPKLGLIYAVTLPYAVSKDKFHQNYIYTDLKTMRLKVGVHVPADELIEGGLSGRLMLLQGDKTAAGQSFTATESDYEASIDVKSLPAGDYQTQIRFDLPGRAEPIVLGDTYRRYPDGPAPWEGNQAGISQTVPEPWTDVVVEGDAVKVWGRVYDFAGQLLPAQITSRDRKVLISPMAITASVNGRPQSLANLRSSWINPSAGSAERSAGGDFGGMKVNTDVRVEFDGFTWVKMTLDADQPVTLDALRIDIPLDKKFVTLRNLGDYRMERTGSLPDGTFGKDLREKPIFWLGDESGGIQWFAESLPGWSCADWSRSLEVINQKGSDRVIARLNVIDAPIKFQGKRVIEFGFIATPVKPVRDDFRSWRIAPSGSPAAYNWYIWFTEWTRWVNYPDPSVLVPEKMDLLNAFHRNGIRVTPYMTLGITTPFSPEFKFYGADWLMQPARLVRSLNNPLDPQWDIWANNVICNNSRSYRDFFAQKMDNMLSRMKFDGIYFDFGTSRMCENEIHGCGYVDNTGHKQKSFNILGTRDIARRAYVIIHKYATKNPLIVHHMSGEVDMATNAYCDIMLTGENMTGALMTRENYYDALPLDKYRAEFIGSPWGPRAMNLPQFERAMAVTSPDRVKFYSTPEGQKPLNHLIGLAVVNDGLIWPSEGIKPDRLWRVQDEFGWDGKVEFFPYWNNSAYITIARPQSADVVVSLFRRGDKLMIVPFNNTDQPVTIKAKINLEALGFVGAGPQIKDEYFGDTFTQHDGQVEIPIDARSFRMVLVTRK